MIEKFNGIIYLTIFIIHFAAFGYYAFRCLFKTKVFVNQYGMGSGAGVITRFFGAIFLGSVLMAIYVGFVRVGGLENTWAFFNLIFVQNLSIFIVSLFAQQKGQLGVNKKTSIEGNIAPGILTLLSAVLCYGLADKIYL